MTHTTSTTFPPSEVRAAAAALAAGAFAQSAGRGQIVLPSGAAGDLGRLWPPMALTRWLPRTPLVRVLAGHAGAGASTVTLALADAAATQMPVRVLDAACPTWSTLAAATSTELGTTEPGTTEQGTTGPGATEPGARGGWRRGRRGDRMLIERLAAPAPSPDRVPVPAPVEAGAIPAALTVLDVGWSAREVAGHPHGWLVSTPAVEVAVTRYKAAAFAQVEAHLEARLQAQLQAGGAPPTLLVVIGAKRWSGAEFSCAGPRLSRLRESAVFMPLVGSRDAGIGPGPLPRPLMSAARRLLEALIDLTGPLTISKGSP
ncbi:MAG: hypothetical protein ABIR82_03695 [Nocardioides sp.]